jgi:phosphoglucomutase
LQYYLEDGTIISVRPSGTEPKIKFYIIHPQPVQGNDVAAAQTRAEQQVKIFAQALDTIV